ncbi:sugar kinase [Veillonella sp. R32]|uniref:sugar kinase n=1 Tax=Veillonella sp. R32 TaxID=2021312 RepID=UPI00138988E7|nr:sugar kinase [Veillonella sp. R32]KAF1682074.1 2-dehydro-3-deoxygluconokinase [Veillonella sp. R32]
MARVLTIGEPMGLMVATEPKALKDVTTFRRYVCGAEVNFAVGMSRLGHETAYISRVGNDPFGQHILDFLAEQHIGTDYVTLDDVNRTGMQLKAKTLEGDPEVVNFRRFTAFSYMEPSVVDTVQWEKYDHLHVTGIPPALSDSCRETSIAMMKAAKEHGVQVSFDTNLRPALWPSEAVMRENINYLASLADIVLPGLGEGKLLTGLETPEDIADFYLKQGAKAVIVKLGTKGSYVKTAEEAFYAPAYIVEQVVDTVGAGDGFAVGTISGRLEGLSWAEAVRRGAAIGALQVQVEGDNEGLPTPEQLVAYQNSAKLSE